MKMITLEYLMELAQKHGAKVYQETLELTFDLNDSTLNGKLLVVTRNNDGSLEWCTSSVSRPEHLKDYQGEYHVFRIYKKMKIIISYIELDDYIGYKAEFYVDEDIMILGKPDVLKDYYLCQPFKFRNKSTNTVDSYDKMNLVHEDLLKYLDEQDAKTVQA